MHCCHEGVFVGPFDIVNASICYNEAHTDLTRATAVSVKWNSGNIVQRARPEFSELCTRTAAIMAAARCNSPICWWSDSTYIDACGFGSTVTQQFSAQKAKCSQITLKFVLWGSYMYWFYSNHLKLAIVLRVIRPQYRPVRHEAANSGSLETTTVMRLAFTLNFICSKLRSRLWCWLKIG
jgi:hypothetical protein